MCDKFPVVKHNYDERAIYMKQSALFFDIDGTLLDERTQKIPQSAVRALRQARENGHLLFINTGRTYCSIPQELKNYEVRTEEDAGLFDGLLCGCGSYLIYHGNILLESHLERRRGREIIDKMYECRLDGALEGTEDMYFSKKKSRFLKLEGTRRFFNEKGIGAEKFLEDDVIYDKLYVYADEESDTEQFFDFVRSDMEIIKRAEHEYEIAQKAYSKATACEFVRCHFGMELDQIYVFGDSNNDLSMFEYADHAVAMGKHSKELEPYTEFVTAKVEEDGIAAALKHYQLI